MLTVDGVAEYCNKCFYYRGIPDNKKQCYYRVWEEVNVQAPSQVLRQSGRCKYVRGTKRH
jgi:hypothetical protein